MADEQRPTRQTDRWITDAELDPDQPTTARQFRERALEDGTAPPWDAELDADIRGADAERTS